MNNAQRLTRDDFSKLTRVLVAEPLPVPDRVWSDADWQLIEQGHKSADMDDKWNAFVEGNNLYLHRSWTGRGIYEARLTQADSGWRITAAVVEGDRSSYRRRDDGYETALLEVLIDGTLLGVFHGPSYERWTRIRAALGMT